MSVFIGSVKGPDHNSPNDASDVWASAYGVEQRLFEPGSTEQGVMRLLDPIAARNLAALLVRASEEVERMRGRRETEETLPPPRGIERDNDHDD